jgi:hypothetical protein
MGLTFDEFWMWMRLGGSDWQRASLDAVGVLAALFGLMAYAPSFTPLAILSCKGDSEAAISSHREE